MSDGTYYFGLVLTLLGVCAWGAWYLRPPKAEPTKPNHARLIAKPGATLDLVDDGGTIVAKVRLRRITRSLDGTTAEFVDYFRYRERNQIR